MIGLAVMEKTNTAILTTPEDGLDNSEVGVSPAPIIVIK